MNPGIVAALVAFTTWGLYPLYFMFVAHVPPLHVVLHRSVWSLVFMAILLGVIGRWQWLVPLARQPRQWARYGVCALLIAANWLVYVHAMQTHQVLQASLGYFINPLFNVALGVLVLRERLRVAQWLAVALAGLGVVWLTWLAGGVPWIALALALLFSLYGLVRKTAPLGALEGLAAETLLLAPLAAACMAWLAWRSTAAPIWLTPSTLAWLALSGPLTALPLMFFGIAARRLTLASVGVLQYVSPSLQLLLGILVFGERFDAARVIGFALIWSALLVYTLDAVRQTSNASTARHVAPATHGS